VLPGKKKQKKKNSPSGLSQTGLLSAIEILK
jgi:hypothetical protein